MENGAHEESAMAELKKLKAAGRIGLTDKPSGAFDTELYGHDASRYVTEISADPLDDLHDGQLLETGSQDLYGDSHVSKRSFTSKAEFGNLIQNEMRAGEEFVQETESRVPDRSLLSREDNYRRKRLNRMLSPERADPFSESTPISDARTYRDIMIEADLDKEKADVVRQIRKQQEDAYVTAASLAVNGDAKNASVDTAKVVDTKKRRWDQSMNQSEDQLKRDTKSIVSEWDTVTTSQDSIGPSSRWDTPSYSQDETPGTWNDKVKDTGTSTTRRNRWDATPIQDKSSSQFSETPTPGQWGETPAVGTTPLVKKKMSRWDATPIGAAGSVTPGVGAVLSGKTSFGEGTPSITPLGMTGVALGTPITPQYLAPDQLLSLRIQSEIDERNKPLTDEDLNQLLPAEGYEVVKPPAGYQPIVRPVISTPTPLAFTPLYSMPDEVTRPFDVPGTPEIGDVRMKPEDYQYFNKLFQEADSDDFSPDEIKERKILALLLKIKNGTPPMRRTALRTITEKAKEFGPGPLFNQILPLMMQSTLEDQERHLLVKVIDRVLYKLDDQVRPYVHKILVVIEPLLIDEDYYARVEGREIISNLAKAAGLPTMIATMRPDIDHPDEYVRNTTARAFAVVASALGTPALILFLRAVCQSKKSWQARHTGIKIVQQIAILMGCAILPHLKKLVDVIAHGLQDEQQKVRTITALALAALAEAAAPYGIEAFDCVLRPLWKGITEHRGKGLAAFLKAIGLIIPLMDAHHANYYTREVMVILINEFSTPDEEMKKIVLRVVKQCVATEGVESLYIKSEILPAFFLKFWIVRNALDRRNYKALVETTVELAHKVGGEAILSKIVDDLKDPSEPYRKMVMETIESIVEDLGILDIDSRLEEQLVDGILYAFQEQVSDDTVIMLNGFGTVVNCLGHRVKPYLPQIAGIIRWRLNTPSARVRQQAADLISRIAVVMKQCDEEQILGHLGLFLYEYLGEEYPEVLGSILGALKAIVNVIGMQRMTPPIKDLLPRLTPILKNRHEKVQENVIDLIGRIADRGGDLVSPKEWDRICFDLLELLKAHKKGIRRAAVNTFGYIARTIGPHDVLSTLLSNLKVQERQLRVCTTVAIAIVAETCLPYSVLPALMNEYRVPELNVQNGVLKALSFMFEYIGEMGKDYIYAVCPLLEDALMDRDLVHRQTASWTCKHLALGVQGLGCEDALQHLLNYVWPNIFESSPHLIQAVLDAVDGFRISLGPSPIFRYLLTGLFHPARKVRETYWRFYNNLYIGQQDALIPDFLEVPDTAQHCFKRYELYLTI